MKKLLFLLLLASPLLADGPKYSYSDPRLNDEMDNIYYGQKYINAVSIRASQLTASTGTIKSFMVVGSTSNATTPTGRIGEQVRSAVTTRTNFAATNTWADLTSISLTPGSWLISMVGSANLNGATNTAIDFGIGTHAGNDGSDLLEADNYSQSGPATATYNITTSIPSLPAAISATTIYYLKYRAQYSAGGPPQGTGRLSATRI